MKISLAKIDKEIKNVELTVIPISVDDKKSKEKYKKIFAKKKFLAKSGELFRLKNTLLLGLGKTEKLDDTILRNTITSAIRFANANKIEILRFNFNKNYSEDNEESITRMICESALMSMYKTDEYKKEKDVIFIKEVIISLPEIKGLLGVIKESKIIANASNMAKDLINLPANIITPKYITSVAKKELTKNIKIKVLDRKGAIKENLNLFEAVGRSSTSEPQFLIMEYKPKSCKNKKPFCFVGKGITYDTGGLSLKPAASMRVMKTDMAGASSVIATIKAISEMNLPYYVVGITPLCENSVGGNSYRVDDIIKAHNGKTVEIVNTDAEGRLVLADALSYAKKYNPEFIIDIATLTGASVIALGDAGACYMSNSDELSLRIEMSSKNVGDKVWRFPLWEEYNDMLKSDFADLKNLNEGARGPGVILGGLFLQNFVPKDISWAHVDVGMSAYGDKPTAISSKGATGIMIRSFIDLVENY